MISTGFVNSIKRGCRQLCGRRIYFFAMTVIPIVLAGFLLGLMRNGLPLHIPTAIVNHDNTESTRKLIRNIKSSEEVSVVSVVSSEAEAMQLIRKGKIYGFYVIPFNFTSDATAGRAPELAYYTNSTFFIPSSLLFRSLKTNSVLASGAIVKTYLVNSGSRHRHSGADAAATRRAANKSAAQPRKQLQRVSLQLFHPDGAGSDDSARDSLQHLARGEDADFTAMDKGGTRLDNNRPARQTAAADVCVRSRRRVHAVVDVRLPAFPLNCSPWQAVGTMLLFVLANQGFAVFISGIMPNLRMALSFCSLFGILTFSIGAFSFPLEDMYGSIAIFSYILPSRYYFLIYVDQMLNGLPLYYSRFYYAALLAFMLLPLLVARRIKRHALHPVYVP